MPQRPASLEFLDVVAEPNPWDTGTVRTKSWLAEIDGVLWTRDRYETANPSLLYFLDFLAGQHYRRTRANPRTHARNHHTPAGLHASLPFSP